MRALARGNFGVWDGAFVKVWGDYMATTPLSLRRLWGNITATAKHNPFSSIFNGLPLKIEIKPRRWGLNESECTDAPHLYMIATRSCRLRHRTFLSQSVTSAFEMVPPWNQTIIHFCGYPLACRRTVSAIVCFFILSFCWRRRREQGLWRTLSLKVQFFPQKLSKTFRTGTALVISKAFGGFCQGG